MKLVTKLTAIFRIIIGEPVMKTIQKIVNRYLRKRLSCGYCGQAKEITWRWMAFKNTVCNCPKYKAECAKNEKIAEKERIRKEKQGREQAKRAQREKYRQEHLFTETANYCLVCGKDLDRVPGQIQFYCSEDCRKRRHNKNAIPIPKKGASKKQTD